MALTDFGKSVRKARIDVGETLRSMALELKTSPSYLSGLETGTKNISSEWVAKIANFFADRNLNIEDLKEQADLSNKSVHLHDGLSQQQKMLIAGFANSPFTPDQLERFAALMKEVKGKVGDDA